jgi:polysaccharide export outer membrane protein
MKTGERNQRSVMRRLFFAVAILLALGAPGAAQEKQAEKKAEKQDNGAPARAVELEGYVIGGTDVITISVWKEPDFSLNIVVRPDGMISMPLLGDIKAEGLTPVQLSMVLAEKLRKYVTDPQVTVIVNQINSQMIYIVGEVNRAGTFPMLPKMTVLMALSGAGGFTQFANTKKIYILRNENGAQKKYWFNYKEVIKGNRPEENILLKPGDTIVVP